MCDINASVNIVFVVRESNMKKLAFLLSAVVLSTSIFAMDSSMNRGNDNPNSSLNKTVVTDNCESNSIALQTLSCSQNSASNIYDKNAGSSMKELRDLRQNRSISIGSTKEGSQKTQQKKRSIKSKGDVSKPEQSISFNNLYGINSLLNGFQNRTRTQNLPVPFFKDVPNNNILFLFGGDSARRMDWLNRRIDNLKEDEEIIDGKRRIIEKKSELLEKKYRILEQGQVKERRKSIDGKIDMIDQMIEACNQELQLLQDLSITRKIRRHDEDNQKAISSILKNKTNSSKKNTKDASTSTFEVDTVNASTSTQEIIQQKALTNTFDKRPVKKRKIILSESSQSSSVTIKKETPRKSERLNEKNREQKKRERYSLRSRGNSPETTNKSLIK